MEQIIRPTGLVDPEVEIRPLEGQVKDVMQEIRKIVERGDRALVTTLTKKLAEELTEYLARNEIKARYLHSDIKTIERTEIIRELRLGKFDVLVGINLLREGLDIPEVGFIGILDADKEGFLRDSKSLIQIIGRAARNASSKVVLYADNMTDSIKKKLFVRLNAAVPCRSPTIRNTASSRQLSGNQFGKRSWILPTPNTSRRPRFPI